MTKATSLETTDVPSFDAGSNWPILTLPPEEADLLKFHYDAASVILEYGSGGSTAYAAALPETLCFSVESDRRWAQKLQRRLDENTPFHQTSVYHANVGPVGAWGRPLNDHFWQYFWRYPLQIWTEKYFRAPDVVLVDGRFRCACVLAACMLTTRDLVLLFDDYYDRPAYSQIEKIVKPTRRVGRMAEFKIAPIEASAFSISLLMDFVNQPTFPVPGVKTVSYDIGPHVRPLYFGGNPDVIARRP